MLPQDPDEARKSLATRVLSLVLGALLTVGVLASALYVALWPTHFEHLGLSFGLSLLALPWIRTSFRQQVISAYEVFVVFPLATSSALYLGVFQRGIVADDVLRQLLGCAGLLGAGIGAGTRATLNRHHGLRNHAGLIVLALLVLASMSCVGSMLLVPDDSDYAQVGAARTDFKQATLEAPLEGQDPGPPLNAIEDREREVSERLARQESLSAVLAKLSGALVLVSLLLGFSVVAARAAAKKGSAATEPEETTGSGQAQEPRQTGPA